QINKKYQEGKSFEEIIGDDFEYYLEEHKPTFNIEEAEKKKKLAEQAEARRRKERPWLYDGTPQVHLRGKYTQYLMDTSIYPKAVR
ncbi:SA1788 family PVL leukocidin-associated protein, partial [Staphylococcus sp. HMSC078A12]